MVLYVKGEFRKKMRQMSIRNKDAPLNYEQILLDNNIAQFDDYRFLGKDYESIKVLNVHTGKSFYLRY